MKAVQRINRFGCAEPELLLWAVLFYALRHILYLMPVIRQMLGGWTEVEAYGWFLPGDFVAIVIVYTWFNRIPESGPVLRWIWRHGRALLTFVYLWSVTCLFWLNWPNAFNPAHRHFDEILVLLGIDLLVITYLMCSPQVKTVFADFPAPDREEQKKATEAALAQGRRQFLQETRLHAPIVDSQVPVAAQEQQLRTALAATPNNAMLWFELALLAYQQQKNDQALALMRKAQEHDARNAVILRSLCELCRQQSRVVEAVRYGTEAVAAAPVDEIAHLNLALALTDYKDPDAAIAHYHRVLNINPQNIQAWLNLAVLLAQQNRKQDALAALDAVLLIQPEHLDALGLKQKITGQSAG